MADIYKINSALGVNAVNNTKVGDKVNVETSDGSTWVKTGNGTVEVTRADGTVMQGITGDIGTGNGVDRDTSRRRGSSSKSNNNTYVQQLQAMLNEQSKTAADQSQSLKDMYAANLESQKQQLESDYNNTLSDLESEAAKLDAIYSEQRRMASGDAAVARKSWNEAANAYGLNSGTQGQAQLAMSNQLQSDLNTLRVAEAEKRAEVERQRTLLGQQYQNAILKAQADNNLQLAQALYQEAVRVDNSIIEASRYDSDRALNILNMLLNQSNLDRNFNYQVSRDNVADRQWQAQFDAAMKQQELENALKVSKATVSNPGSVGSVLAANPSAIEDATERTLITYDDYKAVAKENLNKISQVLSSMKNSGASNAEITAALETQKSNLAPSDYQRLLMMYR